MGQFWNFIRIKYPLNFEYELNIEYEYSVASNLIRILNGVEMSCRDAASSAHKSVPELSAPWPYADFAAVGMKENI